MPAYLELSNWAASDIYNRSNHLTWADVTKPKLTHKELSRSSQSHQCRVRYSSHRLKATDYEDGAKESTSPYIYTHNFQEPLQELNWLAVVSFSLSTALHNPIVLHTSTVTLLQHRSIQGSIRQSLYKSILWDYDHNAIYLLFKKVADKLYILEKTAIKFCCKLFKSCI